MDTQPIQVLLVEDDEDDFLLTRDLLADIAGEPFRLDWVKDYETALAALESNRHDVCLLDYRLGAHNGLEILRRAIARGCTAPFILLTGQGEREVDLEAMKAGAADFLNKGQMDSPLLERSIRYALERQRDREALRQARDDLEQRVQERTADLVKTNAALRAEFSERQRAEEALREGDRRKDEFLAMLAHELRNPLAPILNGLHILRMGKSDGPTTERVLSMMEQQVRNLTRLVDDLLDVSRITRGKIQLRKEVTDLAAVVNHTVETVKPLIELQRHELSVCLPQEPVQLEADVTRLEQILTNLLNNAAKYTEPGGKIWLTAALNPQSAMVEIRIRDNGMGISDELLPHIFDMFTQAHRGLDRSQGGLGIGLTLVQRLVDLHGGSVSVQSDGPGKGSEFLVRLPTLPSPQPSPAGLSAQAQPASRPRLRVLVVEDEVAVAEMLTMLLQLWGHAVQTVYEGKAALEIIPAFRPEVILCDIGLPGMSGYQFAQHLRQQNESAKPVLIAMTGYGQDEDRRCAKMAGFDLHMTKPVDPVDLEKLLASLVSV